MRINWTPLFGVPLHRRLEVLSVAFFVFIFAFLGSISIPIIVYLLIAGNNYWRTVCGLYLAFLIYDRKTGYRGGRGIGKSWVRSWSIWKHAKNYFPIDLVKTADLPPDRNYLVCVFPHGIFSIGAAANFGTSHSKWSAFYPGIRPRLTTLKANTLLPISREIILSCGVCSASEDSLTHLLSQSNDPSAKSNRDGYTSNAVALIVGGFREVYYTYPDTYRFVVAKRRGLVRVALQTGASLVPAISFGENNYYDIVDYNKSGFWRRFIQEICKQKINHFPPIILGRGIFQYNYGLVPRRHPITTVIGAPIHLEKIENPSDKELNETHELFCTGLRKLFDEHKSKYVKNSEDVHMDLV
ncbi:LOW QUALITY PROTEIN: 2-acylglycerol O-acyltransferase 2-like [Sitodiplosis mosellana]|uniref:LOW QUALITY PROTEIN: 2-acylglycerol O-acyltransferase 2-like n=1 Tax=Sitodiplosis mosellana TaxID=263140 RepID=UPI0024449C44|nr:LOW QUALITY PROTEIN: 2-acylglycerol O-acyltransferase 2-like [Sitodiplosis mosellana]